MATTVDLGAVVDELDALDKRVQECAGVSYLAKTPEERDRALDEFDAIEKRYLELREQIVRAKEELKERDDG
jgi:hypothetical protein